MKRLVSIFLLCVMTTLCAAAWAVNATSPKHAYPPDIAHIKKKGTLVVAFYNGNVPPFFYHDSKNQWTGIDIDLAKMIAEQLGVKLVVKPSNTYDGIVDMVARRQADIGMGLLGITPQRALKVRFSNRYYAFNPRLLFSRVQLGERGWTVWDAMNQLKNTKTPVKLGALESSLTYTMIKQTFPNAEIVAFPTIEAALQAATDGKVLATISSAPGEISNWFDSHPQNALRAVEVDLPEQTVIVGIAVPWQSENLRQWLNIYIEYVKMNHIQEHLFEKYNAEGLEN